MPREPPKRKNPSQAARLAGSGGGEQVVYGRTTAHGRGRSSTSGDEEHGVPSPINTMGRPCPPRLHSSFVSGERPENPNDMQVLGLPLILAMQVSLLCRSVLLRPAASSPTIKTTTLP